MTHVDKQTWALNFNEHTHTKYLKKPEECGMALILVTSMDCFYGPVCIDQWNNSFVEVKIY
jgi:hypothetical protein